MEVWRKLLEVERESGQIVGSENLPYFVVMIDTLGECVEGEFRMDKKIYIEPKITQLEEEGRYFKSNKFGPKHASICYCSLQTTILS